MTIPTTLTLSSLCLVSILAVAAACGSKPSPPGPLENVGGSAGREPDAASPVEAAGSGGTGGTSAEPTPDASVDAGEPATDVLDAGADAQAPQGDAAPAEEQGCVIGALAAACGEDCPELDEAADWLLEAEPVAVVRRRCRGADGARYITIGAGFGDAGTGYIYAAPSGELVSVYQTSDAAEFCSDSAPSTSSFYGRVIRDCAAVNPTGVTRPCDGSSGPGNGGRPPEECVYSPAD